jgi:rod shape-determining protein MreC
MDVALLAVSGFLAMLAIVLPANIREAAASALRRTVVAPFVALQRRAELSRTAFLSHDELTTRADSAALRALTFRAVESENDRLRRLLGLGQRLQWGFVAAEALHSGGSGEEFTLTLTAGSNAGVRPFSPVVAPEGLVGMVQTVDPTLSLAIIWSHPDFRVSAMTVDGSAFGIAAAHLVGGADRADRYLLELRGVPFRSELKPGTLVVSSGLGGVYPQGIPIGRVLRELETSEGWARTYLVRPAVLPANVTSVMILRPQRAAAGVQNVWASAASVDSAVRGVVAAGDSIAADSARAVAAQRALLDSLQRVRAAADSAVRAARDSGVAPSPTPPRAPAPPRVTRPDSARRPAAPRPDSTPGGR